MQPIILLTSMIILLGSCNNLSTTKNEFEVSLKKHLEETAFKENSKLKIYDLSVLKIDTVNWSSIDSGHLSKIHGDLEYYTSKSQEILKLIKTTLQLFELYSQSNDKTLSQNYLDEAREYRNKVKLYQDSTSYYLRLDSTIREKIINTKNPETVFRVKSFIKATIYSSGDSSNTLDSMYFFFNKQKEVIDINKLPELR